MATYTLKDLITEYGLPLDVKKPRWYGDYFFRAETMNRTTVSGTIFLKGEEHETKSFSLTEVMQLCYSPEEPEDEPEDSLESLPNPNGLDTDMTHYIKGVTKLFVNKNGVAKPAVFDHFSESDGQIRIYVIKDGETKPGFFLFPQTKYVFPSKDDAQAHSDKEARQFGLSPSRTIVSAFSKKPKARVPSKKKADEEKHESGYHAQVDGQIQTELEVPQKKKAEAQHDLAYADEELREEIVAARENGYRVDDHTYISYQLKKGTADDRIAAAQKEIGRLEGIRRKPYFARIDCGASMSDLHTVYLGDDDIEGLVVSWRHPEYGNAYYQSGILQGRDDLVLALKRIVSISYGKYEGFEDEICLYGTGKATTAGTEVSYEGKSDELLTRLLIESRADKKAHDIIKTIQGEQYEIITSDFRKNAVINGCAGSGKTMIMYHRLSYMAYNYQSYLGKQFNPNYVYIISPSSFFDSSNDELLTKLSIDSVHQSPFYDQVDDLINQYCVKKEIIPFYGLAQYIESRGNSPEDFFSETEYTKYSLNLKTVGEQTRSFRQWVVSIANSFLKLYGFRELPLECNPQSISEVHSLFTTSEYYYNECFAKKSGSSSNLESRRLYSPQAITSVSLANVIKSLHTKHDKTSALFKQRLKKINKSIDMLRCCLSLKDKTDVNSNISTDIGDFWTLLGNSTVFEKMIAVILAEKLLECIVPSKKDETSFMLRCLWVYRDMYSLQQADYIKLYILHALSEKYGPVVSEDALIFIDEFQNYSSFEIRCLQAAYQSPIFNLFGDYDQRIEEKGLDLRENLTAILTPNAYNININYRNAKQITDYINKIVHKNMQSIGVQGTVVETSLDKCQFAISDRTAIICKDPKLAMVFLKRYIDAGLINNSTVTKELINDKYTLMTVLDCKGLEFDTVYVLDYGMTDNEKYVAYTRALDTLVVISDDLEAIKKAEEEAERKRKEEERLRIKREQEMKKKQKYYSELISLFTQIIELRQKAEEEAEVQKAAIQRKKNEYRQKAGSELVSVLGRIIERSEKDSTPPADETETSRHPVGSETPTTPSSKKELTEQELRLEEELRKLAEYRAELERRDQESRQAEQARKEKIYLLASNKLDSDDVAQLNEAVILLETIFDYKDAIELVAKTRVKIMQLKQNAEARLSAEAIAAEERRKAEAARDAEKQWTAEEDRIAEKRRKAEEAKRANIYNTAFATYTKSDDILLLTKAISDLEALTDSENARQLTQLIQQKIATITAEKQRATYRSQKVCQHCGGKFKGLFSKKCSVCGKIKDY